MPIGMTLDDYGPATWVGLGLAIGCALMGLLTFLTRKPASTGKEISDVPQWPAGQGAGLKTRRQFRYALARVCERVQSDRRSPLSLIVLRVASSDARDGPVSSDVIEYVAQALAKHIRVNDMVGLVGDGEIGVLALGAGAEARWAIEARIERAVAAALIEWNGAKMPRKASAASIGGSTLGPDDDPDSLIAAARQAMRPVATHVSRAA